MQSSQHFLQTPNQSARFYAKCAVRALYDEVSLYPKPGLVSFIDNGAHKDMNGVLFLRSLFGLRHYFFHVGLRAALGDTPQQLVDLGIHAEHHMYQITKGVNTHRGAIFALGILCSSLCRLSVRQRFCTLEHIQQEIIEFWSHYLKNHHKNTNTHGSKVKQKYGVADAKQMAIEGYQTIFEIYNSLIALQDDKLFFGLLSYQRLLLEIDDINILYRVGPGGLAFARHCISQEISVHDRETSILAALETHLLFSQKNISPGGVADMLSVLYFLTYLFRSSPLSIKNQEKDYLFAGVE